MRSRYRVVELASSWLGKKESDGSFKSIINIYNSYPKEKLPRGIKMSYSWPWCACTWSALAISLGYTDIIPIEISCGYLIDKAKEMGCWQENDGYVPKPGDGILYDWDDNGIGDNTGWPDHIGAVDYCNSKSGYMTAIEGNYSDSVKKRTISINGKFIRGFITPKYDDEENVDIKPSGTGKDISTIAREVITGLWGNYPERKKSLEKEGFNYEEVRNKVNEILNGDADKKYDSCSSNNSVKYIETSCNARSKDEKLAGTYETTANLYCRNDAGTNKKALCKIPKGIMVHNYGFYTEFNGVKWLLIQFKLGDVFYTGFSSSQYLKKLL